MNREDLKQLRFSIQWVKSQIDKYKEQRELVYNLSQSFDGMPKAQNKPNYALEELIDKYNELLVLLAKEQQKINDTIEQLNMLEPLHRIILCKRYIDGENFETIATDINYSYTRTCRMHGEALNEFDKIGQEMARHGN